MQTLLAEADPNKPLDPDARELTLEVMNVRYRTPDGEFAVLEGVTDDGEQVVVTGAVGHLHVGETIGVDGRWRHHHQHGFQFYAERVRLEGPVSEQALLSYLAAVKHIGPRGAAFLLERHGPEVLATIDRDPRRRLREVPGIGPARIDATVRSWEEQTAVRAVRLFLESHGVEAAVAARIYRAFGAGSIELLRADPYRLTELDGIGFATADALAQALGIEPDAPERIDAGVVHALAEAELDGHCHLPRGELGARARQLLGVEATDRIDALAATGRLVILPDESGAGEPAGDERVADAEMYRIETRLAAGVRVLVESEPTLKLARVRRPTSGALVPTDDQWRGITNALEHRLSILTGLPGTGKTATMRVLIELLRANKRGARLCAPTGKAARRLAESTGAEATTIHRLLEWVPGEGFARGGDNPIEADVLIVDEASMLGVRLAEALLGAVGPRTHVLLVGDIDQLAPIGPGRVLEDLIASGRVPTTALSEIFRQAARSMIVRAAHAINRGEQPQTRPAGDVERDFFFMRRSDPEAIFAEVVSLAERRLPAHYGLDPLRDVQVLAPMRKGPLGIDALNAELRERLNPDGEPVPGSGLRAGDKVIQTRNDHEHEFMNGELAVVLHADTERERALLATDDGRRLALPLGALDTLRLAYAISIHKSQGSQSPAVVVPLWRGHNIMLTRNLLYTAITRAERLCVLVGEPAAIAIAVRRRESRRRYTRLAELVRGDVRS